MALAKPNIADSRDQSDNRQFIFQMPAAAVINERTLAREVQKQVARTDYVKTNHAALYDELD